MVRCIWETNRNMDQAIDNYLNDPEKFTKKYGSKKISSDKPEEYDTFFKQYAG